MDLRDYYTEHYKLEVTRRHELTSALAIPFGVLSLVLAGLAVVAKDIHVPVDGWKYLQLFGLICAAMTVFVTTYFLFRSYFNYEYGYAPTPLEIKSYRDQLLSYYIATGLSEAEASRIAESETLEHIDSEYAAHSHRNTANNDKKSAFLHRANGALILSVAFTIVAGIPYLVRSIASLPEVQRIEVVNLKEAVMATPSNTQQGNKQQQTTQQQTPSQTPAKPSPPPGRVIKENVEPKFKK